MKRKSFAVASVQTDFGEFFIVVIRDAKNFRFRLSDFAIFGLRLQAEPDIALKSFAKFVN